jgi:hypothetical protein
VVVEMGWMMGCRGMVEVSREIISVRFGRLRLLIREFRRGREAEEGVREGSSGLVGG